MVGEEITIGMTEFTHPGGLFTFPQRPIGLLYHYASLEGFEKIIHSKKLWASELHYLNDASEIRHFGNLVIDEARRRRAAEASNTEVLSQLIAWTTDRINRGPLVFASSFSENGNLLSQWRGYCPNGVGVSLGFDPKELASTVCESGYMLRKCIYDSAAKVQIVTKFVDIVQSSCEHPVNVEKYHPTQKYYGTFYSLEDEFLNLAPEIKHHSFGEENEWRLVSKAQHDYVKPDICYRASRDTLVPYMELNLPKNPDGALSLKHVWVGPNPNPNLTMDSVNMFLSKQGIRPTFVEYCQIPYRG